MRVKRSAFLSNVGKVISHHFLSSDEAISQYQKYHNTLCLSLQNFAKALFFIFSWDLQWSQEKLETMPMQNFEGTNKEYYGIFDTG